MLRILFLAIAVLSQSLNAETRIESSADSAKSLESKQVSSNATKPQIKDSINAKDFKFSPSFNCAKAKSKVEKMICNDSSGELQRLDRLYSKLYFSILKSIPKDTQEGQEVRGQMKEFAKNFMDYRDNMRCFLLAVNDDKKEVEETYKVGRENGVMYENYGTLKFGVPSKYYKPCIARVYKMGILLLSANTLADTSSLISEDRDYVCRMMGNMILDRFSIKDLAKFKLYNKFFPQGYEKTIIEATKALQDSSSNGRYVEGICDDKDEGFICSNGGCELDLDDMQSRVVQPLDKFLGELNANESGGARL